MASQNRRKSIPFDNPAFYQIVVLGRITPDWSDHLEGMSISHATDETGFSFTTLAGELSDQAALAGVLDTLYDLHLTLFSLERH